MMGDNCGQCLQNPPEYKCGWCDATHKCTMERDCLGGTKNWLNSSATCRNPDITKVSSYT